MKSNLYWIDGPRKGRLAIFARPRGGGWLEDEVLAWKSAGLDTLVSTLTPEEVTELDLRDEEELCRAHGVDAKQAFESIRKVRGCPVPDTMEQSEWAAQYAGRVNDTAISKESL